MDCEVTIWHNLSDMKKEPDIKLEKSLANELFKKLSLHTFSRNVYTI
jgi:hypothetical protein